MANGIEEVRGKRVLIRFEAKRCVHSRACVLTRPDVFVPNVKGEWLHPDAASPEAVARIAHSCPSGAIQYERLDGGENEAAPLVNILSVRQNGPLALRAKLVLDGKPAGFRATLCRCGASKSKPYCDASHVAAGFDATGEPPTETSVPLTARNGVLNVLAEKDGPLRLDGNLEIVSGTGRTTNRVTKAALCRCGQSSKKAVLRRNAQEGRLQVRGRIAGSCDVLAAISGPSGDEPIQELRAQCARTTHAGHRTAAAAAPKFNRPEQRK